MLLQNAFVLALTALSAFQPRACSEGTVVGNMSAVTSQLTVPCNSLVNLYSHVHVFFSKCVTEQHGCNSVIHSYSYALNYPHRLL